MSAAPQDLLSLALIAAALLSLGGCMALYLGRKVRRSFPRTTLLFMGLALTQLATLAGGQTEPRRMLQVAFIGVFLFVLAVGAYVEGRREKQQAAGA